MAAKIQFNIQFLGTRYCLQKVKELTSFYNTLLNNKKIQKTLAF